MEECVVRLSSLNLTNIKNVKSGQIIMPKAYKKILSKNAAEVLGIYGQNGSGKTAIVDSLFYLQRIMLGESLDKELAEYIDVNETNGEISADFHVFSQKRIYEVTYKILLKRNGSSVILQRETISCAKIMRKKEKSCWMSLWSK